MTTMTMTTTATITITKTKFKIMTGTTIIKYQKTMQVVLHPMMIIITMMTTPRITMKIIITKKMRNMMMIMLMNLKLMIKIQITSINLKMVQFSKKKKQM